jgi:hypothetical protein
MPDYDEELEERLVTYTLDLNPGLIVIEHVPARVNVQTGERFYSPTTVERIHEIIRERRGPMRVIETPVFDFAA